MGQLAEVLYPVPDRRRTAGSTIGWWESRRLLYNGIVASAGLFTIAGVNFFWLLPPFGDGPPPIGWMTAAVLFYALLANICYSLGWVVEILARRLWGKAAPEMGPLLFREGLIFSVGLTLLPIAIAGLAWSFQIAVFLFR